MNILGLVGFGSIVTILALTQLCLSADPELQPLEQCEPNDVLQCQVGQDTNTETAGILEPKTNNLIDTGIDAVSHNEADTDCMRAAVADYNRIDTPNDCRSSAQKNLEVFDKIARIAHENQVQMLVFPEDGLYIASRDKIAECLEEIPDPDTLSDDNNNPCFSASAIFKDTPILTRLSCMAKRYGLYLVANFGTREECPSVTSEQNTTACTKNGEKFLMLNTDVIFDPEGRFIKRYRKWNPYTVTEVFDKAPKLEHAYFDTKFGRFGIFTCFDMIYKEPAIDLVEDYQIDTAIFPTWWFDEQPILTAVQYQDAWSSANKVNLLASNILKPAYGSTGSGIFSQNNSLYVSQSDLADGVKEHRTKLLITNIQTRPREAPATCANGYEPKIIDIDDNPSREDYAYGNYKLLANDSLAALDQNQDKITLCSGEFCCTIDYKLADDTTTHQLKRLVFIVRNGPRPGRFQWYEQVCALATLDKPVTDIRSLIEQVKYDSHDGAEFASISIEASFDTKYVYPSTAHDGLKLIDRTQRNLMCHETNLKETKSFNCRLEYVHSNEDKVKKLAKIYSFAMYGRVYVKDKKLA